MKGVSTAVTAKLLVIPIFSRIVQFILPHLPICPNVTCLSLLTALGAELGPDQFCPPSHSTIILNGEVLTPRAEWAAHVIHTLLQKYNP